MPQVVNSENLIEVTRTGVVPEFKAPEAPKLEASPAEPTKTDPKVAEGAAPDKAAADQAAQPRGEDGKFVKANGEAEPAKGAADDAKRPEGDDDDVKLTRKIERIIAKKHRAQKEAEEFATTEGRRAIQAEQRAADLQRQIDELRGTKSDGAKPAGGEPKPEDFKTVGEYTRALVKYEAQQAGKKSAENAEVSRQQAQANELVAQFVERQAEFIKTHPNYEQIVEEADIEVPHASMQYLIESEMGPALMLHLSENPDVAASLRKLSPRRQMAELGKLEAKLETTTPAPAKGDSATTVKSEVSKAPAPIQPLEAKTTPVQKDPSQMSFQELRAYRQAEARAKRA